MREFKAILFDFDGVIGETMDDNYCAWKNAFSEYGIDFEKDQYFLMEGISVREVAKLFYKKNKNEEASTEDIEKIVKSKEKFYRQNNVFRLYDGVNTMLPELREKGYILGLVSGGSYSRISATVTSELLGQFDVVITGDMVDNCKPHPEPYLSAAERLQLSPSECMVIENAPVGIESAKKAGMYCIAVCSTLDKEYLTAADKTIAIFNDLNGQISMHESKTGQYELSGNNDI